MNPFEKAEFKEALMCAFTQAIEKVGLRLFKQTSLFGSNDPAFKAAKQIELKQAA